MTGGSTLCLPLYLYRNWWQRQRYELAWRAEILKFCTSSPFPIHELADAIERLNGMTVRDKEIDDADEVAKYLRWDAGMSIYATAVRLVS